MIIINETNKLSSVFVLISKIQNFIMKTKKFFYEICSSDFKIEKKIEEKNSRQNFAINCFKLMFIHILYQIYQMLLSFSYETITLIFFYVAENKYIDEIQKKMAKLFSFFFFKFSFDLRIFTHFQKLFLLFIQKYFFRIDFNPQELRLVNITVEFE